VTEAINRDWRILLCAGNHLRLNPAVWEATAATGQNTHRHIKCTQTRRIGER